MKTYQIYMIRHGLTEGNIKGQFVGITDLPVTKDGAAELAKMREDGYYHPVNICFSSPLLRCRQTSSIIYPDAGQIIVEDLRECSFGDYEGKTGEELAGDPHFDDWMTGKISAPPGGEDMHDFALRICSGFSQIVKHLMQTGEREAAAVVHGGVIMGILSACALPKRAFYDWMCGNGRGYVLRITPSVYLRSGMIEVISEIPASGAHVLGGKQ